MKTLVTVFMKDPRASKTRLKEVMTSAQRASTSLALFEHTLRFFLQHFPMFDRLVVTPSSLIACAAQAAGASVLQDPTPGGLNNAAKAALARAAQWGYQRLVLVPADVPVWRKSEVDALLTASARNDVVIGRSRDGGTNALLVHIPRALSFHFHYGPASATRHAEFCSSASLSVAVSEQTFLSQDLDTPSDWASLLVCPDTFATERQP